MSRLGTQLFFDDFENGVGVWNNGGEYNTSSYGFGSSTIEVGPPSFSPTRALMMRTTNSGGGASSDWHAQTNNNRYGPSSPTDNPDIVLNMKLFFPKRIGFNIPEGDWGFFNMFQFKGVGPSDNHPMHNLLLSIKGGANSGGPMYFTTTFFANQWGFGPNENFQPIQADPIEIPVGEWFDLTVRQFTNDGDGIWQVWQDGVQIFDLRNRRTWIDGGRVTRIDASINNYGRYHLAVDPATEEWDGETFNDVFVDDFGVFTTNPDWDYDLDEPINGGGDPDPDPEPPEQAIKVYRRFRLDS